MITVAIEARCQCSNCASPVFVPGMVPTITCSECQAPVDLRPHLSFAKGKALWTSVVEHKPCRFSPEGGRVDAAPVAATCPKCSQELSLPEPPEVGDVACPSCATAVRLRAASEGVPHFVTHILGEDPGILPAPYRGEVAQPASKTAAKPVRFPCPACNGSLSVDGSARTVECTYCGTSAYLPNDLWRQLHPVETKRRFYLCVDEARFEPYRRLEAKVNRWRNVCGVCVPIVFFSLLIVAGLSGVRWWLRWPVPVLAGAVGLVGMVLAFVYFNRSYRELDKNR
jgi:hypothetical protein